MKFSPFILIIFTQKLGSTVNAQSRIFFFIIFFYMFPERIMFQASVETAVLAAFLVLAEPK